MHAQAKLSMILSQLCLPLLADRFAQNRKLSFAGLAAYNDTSGIAFRLTQGVGTLEFGSISRLNAWPMRTPANATAVALLPTPHDSEPVWFANPSLYGTFIHYSMPVLIDAFVPNLAQ